MPNRMPAINTEPFAWVSASMRRFGAIALLYVLLPAAALTQQESKAQQSQPSLPSLNVPVYPGFKPENRPIDIESLRDSYIVLEDGAVLSLADWVLGSLNKSDIGIGMSDYQNRLFLGQVARAAVGMKQDLVYRSFEDAGAPRQFIPHRPPQPVQVAQGLLSMVVPAFRPNWSPAVSGKPTLRDRFDRGRHNSIHFDGQFADSLAQTTEQFSYQGRLAIMLEEFKQNSSP